jgi:hypothetical protein
MALFGTTHPKSARDPYFLQVIAPKRINALVKFPGTMFGSQCFLANVPRT